MENILNTGETEDTPQKTTCEEHPEVAQFVENILDLEETEDTPEKITCYPNFVHFVAFFPLTGGGGGICVETNVRVVWGAL